MLQCKLLFEKGQYFLHSLHVSLCSLQTSSRLRQADVMDLNERLHFTV